MLQDTEVIASTVQQALALYEWRDDPDSELVHSYARFKLGEVEARNWFLQGLASLVWTHLARPLRDYTSSWIIVTPATTELAQDFSEQLRCRARLPYSLPVQVVGPDPHPDSDYTGCTLEQRQRIVDGFYDFEVDLSGKRVLIIDDFLNTGTALHTLIVRLCRFGVAPKDISSFVFVRGRFTEPERERQLVSRAIARMRLDDILTILGHPEHYVTSATMLKYLACRTEEDLERIVATLPTDRLAVPRQGLLRYYRRHRMPRHLTILLGRGEDAAILSHASALPSSTVESSHERIG